MSAMGGSIHQSLNCLQQASQVCAFSSPKSGSKRDMAIYQQLRGVSEGSSVSSKFKSGEKAGQTMGEYLSGKIRLHPARACGGARRAMRACGAQAGPGARLAVRAEGMCGPARGVRRKLLDTSLRR